MVKIVKNISNLKNVECLISNQDLRKTIKEEEDYVIKLNCGHCFCYRSFIKSYIINKDSNFNKCPYCHTKLNKIPIIINKYINK